MNLMTGERSAFALGAPTERKMRYGETGLVEIGAARRRYTSTLGRQWTLGPASKRLRELHATRDPLYAQTAHYAFTTGRASVPSLVNTIVTQLELGGIIDPNQVPSIVDPKPPH